MKASSGKSLDCFKKLNLTTSLHKVLVNQVAKKGRDTKLKHVFTLDETEKLCKCSYFPKRGIKHISGFPLLRCLIILFTDSIKMCFIIYVSYHNTPNCCKCFSFCEVNWNCRIKRSKALSVVWVASFLVLELMLVFQIRQSGKWGERGDHKVAKVAGMQEYQNEDHGRTNG